jgi:hypothetical protein
VTNDQLDQYRAIEAFAYETWQTAEADGAMSDDTEDASFCIGQADVARDLFIRLRRVTEPDFDFQEFCADKIANDPDFIAVASLEDGEY